MKRKFPDYRANYPEKFKRVFSIASEDMDAIIDGSWRDGETAFDVHPAKAERIVEQGGEIWIRGEQ